MAVVYIGIGSNLGERKNNCLRAINLLEKAGVKISKKSSLYETEPWGVKDQPGFINMAVQAETDIPPFELLALCKEIESGMGRQKTIRWGPRTIDLDILFYNDSVISEDDLVIPHPLMHRRRFVLDPLAEIAPEKVHPLLKKKVRDLLVEIGEKEVC